MCESQTKEHFQKHDRCEEGEGLQGQMLNLGHLDI